MKSRYKTISIQYTIYMKSRYRYDTIQNNIFRTTQTYIRYIQSELDTRYMKYEMRYMKYDIYRMI